MMKQKTDLKNKTDNPKLSEDNDIIDLTEKIEKPYDSKKVKSVNHEKSTVLNHDEEIIVLKNEIQASSEENEVFIELTDEVPVTFQKESNQLKYVVIPIEAFKAALEKNFDEVSGLFPGNGNQTLISKEIVDAAIERIIRKMSSEKIELMIREVIKKIVTEDMEKLQKQILYQHEEKA
jgi:hypothetical protein